MSQSTAGQHDLQGRRHAPHIPPGAGRCILLHAFDIAHGIDLDEAERLISGATERVAVRHTRKAPSYFEYSPPPLRITRAAPALELGPFRTKPAVEMVVFDFGAVSVRFRIDLVGPAPGLLDLAEAVFDSAAVRDEARRQAEALLALLGGAARQPRMDPTTEDYAVFHVGALADGRAPAALLADNPALVAQVLRCERREMSDDEQRDALACRVSYGRGDAMLVDWNAAMVLDPDADEAVTVLEFANVELLEMRILDDRLDAQLEEAYRTLTEQEGRRRWWILPPRAGVLTRIGRLQVDSALLFENVNNALKLIGDQYLARLYRMAATRFHLPERDETIGRKLRTLESIYEKLSDHQAGVRADLLEWIIILLIALSIVLPFLGIGK
ncbi:MAG: hypothetical protein KF699_01660 [Phycisphaeraceae bacterium]|nr:hypothetical protein [Phycisphaeraceae bacterium]